jgi:hypothetical protein
MKEFNRSDFDIVEFLNSGYLPPEICYKKYKFTLELFSNHSYDFRVCYALKGVEGSKDSDTWEREFRDKSYCGFLTITENAENESDLREALIDTYNTLVEWGIIVEEFPFGTTN